MDLISNLASTAGMPVAQFMATAGAAAGFLGGLCLAYAGGDELRAHRIALAALDLQVATLRDPGQDVAIVTGVDVHLSRGRAVAAVMTTIGVVLLGASFVLTVLALLSGGAGQ